MPVEVKVHIVPNFKAPVNGKMEPRWLMCGNTFTIQTTLLKIGHLLYKAGHFDAQSLTTILQRSQSFCHIDLTSSWSPSRHEFVTLVTAIFWI